MSMRRLTLSASLLAVSTTLLMPVSCARNPVGDSAAPLRVVTPHAIVDGVIVWDPNEEPVFALSAMGEAAEAANDQIVWRQTGWPVDDTGWRGRDLRVPIETPGCGYGGHGFEVTVATADGRVSARVEVWMERYICAGSPWQSP